MMGIASHIRDLLVEHDCVIVPDFGGFVCNYKGSTLDTATNRVVPAAKEISFNANLKTNDGLLASWMQQMDDVSYADAVSNIRQEIISWKSSMDKEGRLQIDGVGILYIDSNKRWRFEAESKTFLNLHSYGLPELVLEPVAVKVKQEDNVVSIEKENEGSREVKKKKSNTYKWVVAAACMLPIAFYSYWIPAKTNAIDRGYVTAADFNPFSTSSDLVSPIDYAARKANISEAHEIDSEVGTEINALSFDSEGEHYEIPVKSTVVKKEIEEVETIANSAGSFHIIAGCFSKSENAIAQVSYFKAQGFQSYVLDTVGGLQRVCVQSYGSKEEASGVTRLLSEKGNSTWILKK